MNLQKLLNQFMGSSGTVPSSGNTVRGIGDTLNQLSRNLPSGLAGGALAGGIVALLAGNKSARKFAGSAAGYGGAALLGGLAYKAYQNWRHSSSFPATGRTSTKNLPAADESAFVSSATLSPDFQLTLIKALIAAAKADGHIDDVEQARIFTAVDQMDLAAETKGLLLDLLRQPISIEELSRGIESMEQKTELYLASCLMTDPDHPDDRAHLDQLARALKLPPDLSRQLQLQAQQAMTQAA